MPVATDHPLVEFAKGRAWDYRKTACYFRIPYSSYKQIVRGFTGVSYTRAKRWEKRSKGEVKAISVMEWYERNRVSPNVEGTAA